jgi:hypothetical protein
MALNYLLSPEFQISVTSGKPDTGGWVEVFLAGTRTKYFTSCDFNGTKNPFRVPLDSLGQALILAETGSLYDVFVYNRYGTLLFSRYNVAPQDGGGISSVNITSVDGSIVVTNTGNGVDLSVNGYEPSVLRATASTLLEDGPFSFTRRQVSGHQIEVSNGHVLVDTGWYHYDITVKVIWDSVLRDEHAPITLTANTDSASITFDLSRVHDETIQLSGEFRALQDNTEFTVSMSGLPTGIAVDMTDFGMHSIKGLGANGTLGPVYEGTDGVIVDNENDTITCDYDVVQRKLTEGDNISIDENQRISADVGKAILTIQKNGTAVQTFSANEKTDKTANITVPTKTSEITNDSGFITSSDIPAINNGTLTIQKNGSSVATFTANSSSNVTANISVPTKGSDIQNDLEWITSSDLPTVGNGRVTIKRNSSTVGSFTVNQSAHTAIDISVPTKTSDLQNDSGYITSADLPTVGNGTITLKRNSSTVGSFTTNQSGPTLIDISVPTKTSDLTNDSSFITLADVPECNLYVATYNVSTFSDVLAAYNAGKVIILTGADFGSNIHTQMLMYDFNTTSGQTRKFMFAPTVVPRVAAYYKYYAMLDETNGWSKDYFSNTAPTKCGGVFQLSGDETAHNLIEHRGWLCNNIYNFDLTYFCSANACNIYLAYVDQPFHVDVVGMRRGIRNDRMASIDQTTTVQTLVRDIDVSSRIVMTGQPLNATNQRIDIATLGPQELSNFDYDVYWDLDLIFTQWGVTGSASPCYHLHLEKFGQPSAGHNYLFATLTGSDLY